MDCSWLITCLKLISDLFVHLIFGAEKEEKTMSNRIIHGYEPTDYFNWFEEISKIPHGSGKEHKLGDFILKFAHERELFAERDEIGNIFVKVPASKGYEDELPILIQSHLDMVWEKNPDVKFDFETEALRLLIKNDVLCADGTTLGADNGVGIAFMLTIANNKNLAHPALELLFTVQEEPGLIGIQKFDMSKISSRRMINTDCGATHLLCVSSVGALDFSVKETFPISTVTDWKKARLIVQGGLGGHSGLMIHAGRASAISIAGEILHSSAKNNQFRISSFVAPGNAIHTDSSVIFSTPADKMNATMTSMLDHWDHIRDRYAESDPNITISIEPVDDCYDEFLSNDDTKRVLYLLYVLPNAAIRHDGNDTNIVISSASTPAVKLHQGRLEVRCSIQSAIDSECESIYEKLSTIIGVMGFHSIVINRYIAWPYNKDSAMARKTRKIHQDMFGYEIGICHIHGGIEVSHIINRIPDMDAIGIQPTAMNWHTPEECLFLKEVQPFWDLMIRVLEEKQS